MSEKSTAVEKITTVIHPIWTYYSQQMSQLVPPKSIQDNIASSQAQRMLDAFRHLDRAQACFLGLVMGIISDEDSPAEENDAFHEDEQWLVDLIRKLRVDITPRPGFREELLQRILATFDEMNKP